MDLEVKIVDAHCIFSLSKIRFLVDAHGVFPHSKLKFLVDVVWTLIGNIKNIFTNILVEEKTYELETCIYFG